MYCTRNITESIHWVGGSDRRLALFENLFPIPRGVAYNSYLILDEKTALIDTVDSSITRQFVENILHTLGGRPLDYLVVNHMEPDHCASIEELMLRFPNLQIVGNAKTFALIGQFYHLPLEGRTVTVKEGDTLPLGRHTLCFTFTPMVHWPEVMMTYERSEKILFSADAFGSFGALGGNLFNDELHFERDWLPDARRYFANIVGKYGPQVQAALKKLSGVDIRLICPLHGPVWRSDLAWFLNKYDLWSRYEPEERAVALFYGSMYGDTENAVNILAGQLAQAGVQDIAVYDVSSTHVSQLIAEIFRCSHLVFAAPTYNNGVYPAMANLLHDMKALNVQNRTVGLVENGSWAPAAGKQMAAMLGELKGMQILEPVVTLKSALDEQSLAALTQLGESLAESLRA
ncbi:FprA family A-type flavoprotein [Feifania hominis]|uniref:FprA family A-type flavoprotein n=1 Tax=Feifania hominis TaxID=2763660 RepID=A0A926HVB6_9FIRM|nr:FprA family A-type flavoprotein [Feifania hominis]MBC8537168.1 FprA family A-type flavoprotein [Feifania hominis]